MSVEFMRDHVFSLHTHIPGRSSNADVINV